MSWEPLLELFADLQGTEVLDAHSIEKGHLVSHYSLDEDGAAWHETVQVGALGPEIDDLLPERRGAA